MSKFTWPTSERDLSDQTLTTGIDGRKFARCYSRETPRVGDILEAPFGAVRIVEAKNIARGPLGFRRWQVWFEPLNAPGPTEVGQGKRRIAL